MAIGLGHHSTKAIQIARAGGALVILKVRWATRVVREKLEAITRCSGHYFGSLNYTVRWSCWPCLLDARGAKIHEEGY